MSKVYSCTAIVKTCSGQMGLGLGIFNTLVLNGYMSIEEAKALGRSRFMDEADFRSRVYSGFVIELTHVALQYCTPFVVDSYCTLEEIKYLLKNQRVLDLSTVSTRSIDPGTE